MRAVFSAFTLVAALVGPAAPAQAAPSLLFISNHDGRCLDADISTATHDGTKVQAWQCIDGNRNQQWRHYSDGTIRSLWDGRCLDEDIAGGVRNGTKVQLWACNGWLNQKWNVNADGTITNRHDGRCLDEDIAGGTRNGTKVQVWDCNGWLNQKWHR
ncbi:RICIN domain-containing protein [Paractinoplanes lichenicola]|uniref:RICIN domain-containing protein n=1 Tax=Paractinoplanes lichenicola TaxID=2802976 RepID=A0ABS1VTD6_9ACTN|nr:RICIN domain-containing protein [Actinoplanes lichenicola]MBL7257732.1 RICIN domain-containing protein [Actinoplanes lichenicola]